jgi:hypothetical protein
MQGISHSNALTAGSTNAPDGAVAVMVIMVPSMLRVI